MYKKACLLFLFASVISAVQGQDYYNGPSSNAPIPPARKKFLISVSSGLAIPESDFGSTNVKNSFWDFNSPDSTRLQGFAKTGFHLDASVTYLFQDNIGIMFEFGSNSNTFDINAFSATMGYPAFIQTQTYHTREYLMGPYFSFAGSGRLSVTGKVLVGFIGTAYPTLTVKINDTLDYTRDISQGHSAFGFCVGAGLSYKLTDNLDIALNVAYSQATIKYPSWIETYQLLSSQPSVYYYLPLTIYHNTDQTEMKTGILKPTLSLIFKP